MTEPTKVCAACQARKPWSDFHAKVKWDDGTTRQPQSRCKVCQGAASRANPEPRRRYDRRRYAQIRHDPEAWAQRLEDMRFHYRKRAGVGHLSRREFEPVRVDAGPFVAWIRKVAERDRSDWLRTCARLGVDESVRRRLTVDLGMVERGLIADDTILLADLYPALVLDTRSQ